MGEFNILLNPCINKKTLERAAEVKMVDSFQTGEIVWTETSHDYIVSYNVIKGTVACTCPSMVQGGRICKHVVALVNDYHKKTGTENPLKEEDVVGD